MNTTDNIYLDILKSYLGNDFVNEIEQEKDKLLLPGGQQMYGHLLKFEILNFPFWSEVTEPAEMFSFINSYCRIIFDDLTRVGGNIYRIDGPDILAYFPDAENVSEMLELVEKVREKIQKLITTLNWENEHSLYCLISYNIGNYLIGRIGCKGRLNRIIIGFEITITEKLSIPVKKNCSAVFITEKVLAKNANSNYALLNVVRMVGYKDDIKIFGRYF